MSLNKVFLKYYELLGDNLVRKVCDNFQFIGNTFYEDRNVEEVVDSYLHMEKVIKENFDRINDIRYESEQLRKQQSELINYVVNKLRNQNVLVDFLKNKDMETINKIKSIVDIKREFEIVDKMKFEEMKRNRGSSVSVSLNN
jgi:hypothetical protein